MIWKRLGFACFLTLILPVFCRLPFFPTSSNCHVSSHNILELFAEGKSLPKSCVDTTSVVVLLGSISCLSQQRQLGGFCSSMTQGLVLYSYFPHICLIYFLMSLKSSRSIQKKYTVIRHTLLIHAYAVSSFFRWLLTSVVLRCKSKVNLRERMQQAQKWCRGTCFETILA